MNKFIAEITELVNELNAASRDYYNCGNSALTDKEFDKKLARLQALEKESGIVLSNSPSINVGAEVLDQQTKRELGARPMLSLAKVHSMEEIHEFANGRKVVCSCKLDGLSVRICYQDGQLSWAATRGNGTIGLDITSHIKQFANVPLTIPTSGVVIVDGEAIITKHDFQEINSRGEYKNPRNLAAGTLGGLDTSEVKARRMRFVAWDMIEGFEGNSYFMKMAFVRSIGFEVVEVYSEATNEDILAEAEEKGWPCDGVVWKFDDIAYGDSLGATAHHFNNGIAWKPEDESEWSHLLRIEYTMGRTGTLTPVAVFDPIELEGSTVERASLHNISIMHQTLGSPYFGQEVEVIKTNQIIPQIKSSKFADADTKFIPILTPETCPICGGPVILRTELESTVLVCPDPACPGKLLNRLDHFCGKNGLDIKGLSKATLDKLIDWGWVNNYNDLYLLKNHRIEWTKKAGFGVKSVDNILNAIEASRHPTLHQFLSAIGIPLVGGSMVKNLCAHFDTYEAFRKAVDNHWDFSTVESFGPEKSYSVLSFDYTDADQVFCNFELIATQSNSIPEGGLSGKNIVITGRLTQFKNRAELVSAIEARGGKVVGSVSGRTNYLINNDKESTSDKNRQAQKLGVEILSEADFIQMFLS
jgi:DNA ligase (NAD+)